MCLLDALEEISLGTNWKGQDVVIKMMKTNTYFPLLVARALYGACESLAQSMQGIKTTFSSTFQGVGILEGQLERMADARFLKDLWKQTKEAEKECGLQEPKPRRVRLVTAKLKENGKVDEIPCSLRKRKSASQRTLAFTYTRPCLFSGCQVAGLTATIPPNSEIRQIYALS